MKQTTIWTIRLQLNTLNWQDETHDKQRIIVFVTGPAGAGKCATILFCTVVTIVSDDAQSILFSHYEEVLAYAKLFSQNISHPFSRQNRVTAMTGAAAMEIGGVTTASEFHYAKQKLCYAR
jgi:hypothetical protein